MYGKVNVQSHVFYSTMLRRYGFTMGDLCYGLPGNNILAHKEVAPNNDSGNLERDGPAGIRLRQSWVGMLCYGLGVHHYGTSSDAVLMHGRNRPSLNMAAGHAFLRASLWNFVRSCLDARPEATVAKHGCWTRFPNRSFLSPPPTLVSHPSPCFVFCGNEGC
ncbi:hypothetical protein BDB00DRAFT_905058 [Zychaea mexicana]|uniref:uncharacterized protein n=1 Tax=Zychaea mexicana TaxID=64656 RepID=UPI0022FEA9C8|nr:uncharacterized protein BDB00DRAFT_905058 [Zychaea mexicana]KAI9493983.1 hypothetical protein BDB00DRAFT_905058 [Zychaea mexicana]